MHDTLLTSSMRVSYLLQYRILVHVISLFLQSLPPRSRRCTIRIPRSTPSRIGAAPLARTTALSLLLCVPMIMAGIVLSNPTAPFNALRAGRPYLFGWLGKHRLQLIIGVS